jgi:S-adenosylmethionine decarboxylase
VELLGATQLGETFHKFSPQGVTGVVSIAESHLCIHTWPEYRYAAVDVFTCGDSFNPMTAADYIIERLGCKSPTVIEMRRGIVVNDLVPAGR